MFCREIDRALRAILAGSELPLTRAATFGAIGTLVVDIDDEETGTVNEDGSINIGDGSHGLLDQIAALALATGARVLGERRKDIPGGGSFAAILRYPF